MLHALICVFALLAAAAPGAARADDDLPGRVGRIADFAGQLFLSTQDRAAEWAPVGINYPVTSGDNLYVSGDGRAEIDYGAGQLRLAGDTSLHVSRLDDRQLALFVAQGRLIVRVRLLESGDAALVDTPNAQVALTRPGLYRIDASAERQATTVSVREGEAVVTLASGAQQILPGQTMTVTGPEPLYAEVRNGFGLDGFDAWAGDRDRRYERGRSATYVSREMVGYAELDEYGVWESAPNYGAVWYPSAVATDWTPYRYGYWTSVGGWGLTWVDAAPWGFAPSHYGRWVRIGGRWGWCPGAYVARPRWAPALVAWYGGGSWGQSPRAGGPVYGWVPLGWGDSFHPWWRNCSDSCWAHYNRPYAVNVTLRPFAPPARYSNSAVPGAMTAVAAPTLAGGKPVAANRVEIPGSLANLAPVLSSAPAVTPRGPQQPGIRPGERGTPVPAGSPSLGSWRGRDPGVTLSRPSVAPGTPVPPTPPATPSPVREPRRGAPAPMTPGAGGSVVAAPPARGDASSEPRSPRGPGISGPTASTPPALPLPQTQAGRTPEISGTSTATPSTLQAPSSPETPRPAGLSGAAPSQSQGLQAPIRGGTSSGGGPPAGRASVASPGNAGIPMPPPRPATGTPIAQPPTPAATVAPVALPAAPSRPVPAPSTGLPHPPAAGALAPATPAPAAAASQPAPSKSPDAGKAADKSPPAPATPPK